MSGATLGQDGKKPIEFPSKLLKDTGKQYATGEFEIPLIVWALEHFSQKDGRTAEIIYRPSITAIAFPKKKRNANKMVRQNISL